jgi:hypothetical protein
MLLLACLLVDPFIDKRAAHWETAAAALCCVVAEQQLSEVAHSLWVSFTAQCQTKHSEHQRAHLWVYMGQLSCSGSATRLGSPDTVQHVQLGRQPVSQCRHTVL